MRRNYFMKSISIIFMLLAMLFSCDQPTDVGSNNSNNQQNQNQDNQNGENTGNEDNKDDTVTTGKIVGKATYTNTANHAGIQVTLVSSDGIVAYDSQISSRSRSNVAVMKNVVTSESGEYSFEKVKEGVYTIYASSDDSTEKAVLTNVVVQANQVVTAADLNLTATGSICGRVTLDSKEDENLGITVVIAGTSYMAVTDDSGNFTIFDIPAGADYQIVIMKGDYCTIWSKVSVEAGKENKLGDKNITSQNSDDKNYSFIWQGSSATPPANPEKYWAYFDTDDGCSYIYDGEKWTLLAQAGKDGEDGENGTGGSGSIYSYTVNIDDIDTDSFKEYGYLAGFPVYFLTAEQARLCQEAGGFNSDIIKDKLYYAFLVSIPDTVKIGNYGVLGQLQNPNDLKTNFLNGIAATVTDTTLTITVDMTKIEQTQLIASIGGAATKNDIVDLTGYRPYIAGLGDKTTNPDDFVAEGLMKMTPTTTFPTDIQYVPVSCYKLAVYFTGQDSGSLIDNSFIFMGDDSFEFVFMDSTYPTVVYGGVEIDSLDKEIRLVDGGMISFADGVLTDGKAYVATLIVKGDQEAYVKVTEAEGIGCIAYSDGTISAEYDSAKTAVGVVIEATNGTATKIVSLTETTAKWSIEKVDTNATSETDGMANLRAIQSIDGWEEKYPAFKWCDDYADESGNSEWYLPAKDELNQLYNVKHYVNAAIKKIVAGGGNATVLDTGDNDYYWSSSQYDNDIAWGQIFSYGDLYNGTKNYTDSVRAVRAF